MSVKKPTAPDRAKLAKETAAFLRNLHQLNRGIGRSISPVLESEQGIDLRLYFVLKFIERGIIHPGAISQATHLPNSVITRHLDQLVDKGLLERSLDTQDSRRIRLTLTKDGARVGKEADRTLLDVVGARLGNISADRRRIFLSVLSDLAEDVELV